MTHQLDLTPDLEAKLQALAEQRGQNAEAVALQVLAEGLRDVEASAVAAPKPRRELQGHGKFAWIGVTADDFLREKHEEARREAEREEARHNLQQEKQGRCSSPD